MAECDCDFLLPNNQEWEQHYDNCSLMWTKRSDAPIPKNKDGSLRLPNKNLAKLDRDVIYHLGLDTVDYDLPAMFGDVKFVCMGGTKQRMKEFAKYIADVLKITNVHLINLTKHSHRYALYKVGPVIAVNHGIGVPSMTVVLQEVIKLLYYAKAKDPVMFRIGTSGGLKIPPGSVVISSWSCSGTLEKTYDIPILGEVRKIPAIFDKRLTQELQSLVTDADGFGTFIGGTFVADDFYREIGAAVVPTSPTRKTPSKCKFKGQARLDGPFCDHTEEDKINFLHKLSEMGVKNIEMEATAFAAFTHEAGIRAADLCITFLDRLMGDQVTTDKSLLLKWQERPMIIVGRYIAKYYEGLKANH